MSRIQGECDGRRNIIDIVQYLYYKWTAPAVTPAVTPAAIPTATHGGSSGDVPVPSGQQGQREKQGSLLAVVGQDRRAGLTGFRRS
ncbi:hypothetical protein ElyMa_004436200 [Elysia marginata]|uniref:Uncharacterized protein n=1 Tax=Elysia marginata TaxID=1093978 RepID=A0AAV4HCT3_9GAST|nr:hypothetical protein ElyMa_004436200 [Elysia marginata]